MRNQPIFWHLYHASSILLWSWAFWRELKCEYRNLRFRILKSLPVNYPSFNKRHHTHKMIDKQDHVRQNSLFGLHNRLFVWTISRFMNAKLSHASIRIHDDDSLKFKMFECWEITSWFQFQCNQNSFFHGDFIAIFQVT